MNPKNGEILAEVSYPICGLLSDMSGEELADEKRKLNGIIHELGSPITIPFMFLSFICLAASTNVCGDGRGIHRRNKTGSNIPYNRGY